MELQDNDDEVWEWKKLAYESPNQQYFPPQQHKRYQFNLAIEHNILYTEIDGEYVPVVPLLADH
ncbi:unnamed protein product, partial [Rotaria magnacalcarata]